MEVLLQYAPLINFILIPLFAYFRNQNRIITELRTENKQLKSIVNLLREEMKILKPFVLERMTEEERRKYTIQMEALLHREKEAM